VLEPVCPGMTIDNRYQKRAFPFEVDIALLKLLHVLLPQL
jgi:hypothetical protein